MASSIPEELTFLLHVNGFQGKTHLSCSGLFLPKQASEIPDLTALKELLHPLLSFGNPQFHPREFDYIESVKMFAGDGDPNRVYFKGKSDYSVALWSDQMIQALLTALRASPVFHRYDL